MEPAVVEGVNQSCSEYRAAHRRETNAATKKETLSRQLVPYTSPRLFFSNFRQRSMFSPKDGGAHPWNHLYIASPSSDIFPTAAQSPQALLSTAPLLLQPDFPEYASRSCSTRNGRLRMRRSTNEMWYGFRKKNRKKKNSRGSRKRDNMVAERTNPCKTQLGYCDSLSVCYCRQVVHEFEVMSDVLGIRELCQWGRAVERKQMVLRLTSSWKRLNVRLASSSARSLRLLIWPESNPWPSGLFAVRRRRWR